MLNQGARRSSQLGLSRLVVFGMLAAAPCRAGEPVDQRWVVPLLGSPGAARLLGLDPATLEETLGLPDLRREDSPAEYWRYTGERCALDLFLYHRSDGEGLRVVHARLRPRRPEEDASCDLPLRAPPAGRSLEGDEPVGACCA
jgi:hypothetical protein